MRRLLALVMVAAALASGRAAPLAQAAPVPQVRLGKPVFWSGAGKGTAWEYKLQVRGRGDRLRIGIDHATVGDVFDVQVLRPDGQHEGSFSPGDGLYSAELVVPEPPAGTWRIEVTASAAKDPRFRMRAALENAPRPSHRKVAVPPNLQALPPYEFNFFTPLTNGSTGGAPEGIPAPGGRASCHPEEVIEEHAVRCLRMAFGVRNTGQGPMQLFYTGSDPTYPDQTLYQRLLYADGSYRDRVAGKAVFHKTHQHYHHAEAVSLRLYTVTGSTLTPAGAEHRKGFAHRSEQLREWQRFYPTGPRLFGFGLDAGWGDYYEWDRPGNYVDFGLNGDGRYVVRMVADPGGGVLESNERDNTSYSYFEVTGDTIRMLESGRGASPWDRCKIVVPFGAEPSLPKGVTQPVRPRDCPPDTI